MAQPHGFNQFIHTFLQNQKNFLDGFVCMSIGLAIASTYMHKDPLFFHVSLGASVLYYLLYLWAFVARRHLQKGLPFVPFVVSIPMVATWMCQSVLLSILCIGVIHQLDSYGYTLKVPMVFTNPIQCLGIFV